MNVPRNYSRYTREVLLLLGKQIRIARKEQHMSEQNLAERVGVSRGTLRQIEQGAPSVAVGVLIEAAVIAGVELFIPEATTLAPQLADADYKLRLLPKAAREPAPEFNNDF